jgi:predicted DNA-binding antitoxin AbrB/MazE fold protein
VQTDDARTSQPTRPPEALELKNGELVEVRSPEEILASLDERGRLDALPFMPEMLQFAGRQFRVSKRAFKTCDQVKNSGMYRMERTVHLEGLRCDGSAHGGCQAGCLIFWKEGWLKRAGDGDLGPAAATADPAPPLATLETLQRETRPPGAGPDEEIFSCQNTAIPEAAPTHIPGWDVRQYVQDVTSGNAPVRQVVRGLAVHLFNKFQWANRKFLPRFLLIDGGRPWPRIEGRVQGRTPKETLDLQPGELVEVKSKEEIFETLDQTGHNRGLRFDIEMLRYCGKRARVQRRVNRLIDEKTGKMVHIKGDCIVLDGFICFADYHQSCPRGIEEYWREIWLKRV